MSEFLDAEDFDRLGAVKRVGAFVPITAQQLLDAGLPLPEGMEPPPTPPRPSLYRRWRWGFLDAVRRMRERVGFWIAGYEPDDGDW
ncbi:hypothetical protein CLM62_12815 [Streptomyces sp. SA15]|uniref:hypothetical protein n=1 Tax=Streptomyces sp. SA15 TaxID=934019 RepID=UPI000BAE7410|nr:hypothetical protein [Streptomyces sp. SA15]PAZ15672.1 hypothetical protein CLM62_12815 [Streptomyces sp. SA15]